MSSPCRTDDIYAETLTVFDRLGRPDEPLTTPEVASALDLPRRTVYKRLKKLADGGSLRTKKVGSGARVWWRPSIDAGKPPAAALADPETDPAGIGSGEFHIPFRNVLDAAGAGVIVIDDDRTVIWIDRTAQRFLGLDRTSVLGEDHRRVFREHVEPILDGPAEAIESILDDDGHNGDAQTVRFHVAAGPDREGRWIERRTKRLGSGRYAGGHIEIYLAVSDPKERERALARERAKFSDRVIEVEFRSEELAGPFPNASDAPIRFSIDRTVPLADGAALHYCTVDGLSAPRYRELIEGFPSITDMRVLLDADDRARVEVRVSNGTLTSVLATFGGRLTSIRIADRAIHAIGELPSSSDVRAVTEAVRCVYPGMELVCQRHGTRRHCAPGEFQAVIEDSLTDRQRAAIESAFFSGYFEWPRDITAEELADLHGVHPSTFHHHLRHAQRKLVGAMFGHRRGSR